MDKHNTNTNQVIYIPGYKIDREKWDHCIENAVNGNICAYSWFLDIMCNGWDGLVAGDYEFIMPIYVAKRFGISYLFQPRFIQQSGIFGIQIPEVETINYFLEALPKKIRVVDYHFNHQNNLPRGWNVEMRPNFLLKLHKPYEELKLAYSQNLVRNLKKSSHSGFHIIKNDDPERLIKLFRDINGHRFSFLNDQNYRQLTLVINACIHRSKAKVWSVFNHNNELCAGVIWLFSHGKAVFYFSAQSNEGRAEGAMAWLIDAFICEHASSGMILDFEGSVDPGIARFYKSFGPDLQLYPRLKSNNLSPFIKMVYLFYRKLKKG